MYCCFFAVLRSYFDVRGCDLYNTTRLVYKYIHGPSPEFRLALVFDWVNLHTALCPHPVCRRGVCDKSTRRCIYEHGSQCPCHANLWCYRLQRLFRFHCDPWYYTLLSFSFVVKHTEPYTAIGWVSDNAFHCHFPVVL